MSRSEAVVDVGTPSRGFAAESWSTTEMRYHGFAELPAVQGEGVSSPEFTCAGRQWILDLYPGGYDTSDDGMVSLSIKNLSQEKVKVRFGIGIKNIHGKQMHYKYASSEREIPERSASSNEKRGFKNFIKRSELLGYLVEGALVLDVKLQIAEPRNVLTRPFIAANPFCSTMLKLFNDEESADVSFEVEGQGGKRSARKTTKTSTANEIFYAHRLILKNCALQLADMCGSGGKDVPVPVIDIKPNIFRHLLHYIYGGKVPDDDMEAHAKEIIDAADRYGVPSLKLEAEARYVMATAITFGNVMENLAYADSKNCALLKEAVMDFMVENKTEVLQRVSFDEAPSGPTIIRDIFAAVARADAEGGSDGGAANEYGAMRIGDLRRMAHERGLDVDGSREALIASLEEDP